MNLKLFSYTYPPELTAQHPLPKRDQSRMMIVNRKEKTWEHKAIFDFPNYLNSNDLVIFNNTKVFPARLFGRDKKNHSIEILLLNETENKNIWRCLGKPFKKIGVDSEIYFEGNLQAKILKKEDGILLAQFSPENYLSLIYKQGLPPLPPYIKRLSKTDYTSEDKKKYQSIFAEKEGSSAAPTASLHFSEPLIEELNKKKITMSFITLHVSTDTFLPIRAENIQEHKMHGEHFFIPEETQKIIAETKKNGGRIIAIGTTVTRAIESDWTKSSTHLFIQPGFKFKIVDAMLTNFHQPESTLLVLVSSFADREWMLKAYAEAIHQKYRLFSYGDCMLIM